MNREQHFSELCDILTLMILRWWRISYLKKIKNPISNGNLAHTCLKTGSSASFNKLTQDEFNGIVPMTDMGGSVVCSLAMP